jgi:hypothetical protein
MPGDSSAAELTLADRIAMELQSAGELLGDIAEATT